MTWRKIIKKWLIGWFIVFLSIIMVLPFIINTFYLWYNRYLLSNGVYTIGKVLNTIEHTYSYYRSSGEYTYTEVVYSFEDHKGNLIIGSEDFLRPDIITWDKTVQISYGLFWNTLVLKDKYYNYVLFRILWSQLWIMIISLYGWGYYIYLKKQERYRKYKNK